MIHVQAQGGRPDQPTRRRRRGDDGAALVEFGIIAPLLFALLFGLVTGGLALSRKNSMTNGVREGARLGATLLESETWETSVRDRVLAIVGNDLEEDQICVELAAKSGAGETTVRSLAGCAFPGDEPSMPSAVQDGECVVKVWAQRESDFNAIFFRRNLTLKADAIARFERGGTGGCAT